MSFSKVFDHNGMDLLFAGVEKEYRRRTEHSAQLHNAARAFLPGGDTRRGTYFAPYPIFIDSGSGCHLKDVDGHNYLDFLGNYTSMIHGHGHHNIVEQTCHQLRRGTAFASPLEIQTIMAHALCSRVRSLERIRFCNSGTEATLNAIRAAKAFTRRNKIMKVEGGYHGSHDAVEVSITPPLDAVGPTTAPHSVPSNAGVFRGVVEDVIVAPFNDLETTANLINQHGDDLAALIIEPVLGSAMVPASHDYLRVARDATRSVGALLIFDEVITFRLAYGGAQELYGVTPDLTALGKVIGGGVPVGAFGGRSDIMALFDPEKGSLSHSGTFNGNAVTMAAGLASLELLTPRAITEINELGNKLRTELCSLVQQYAVPVAVTGIGSLLGIHFTSESVTDYRSAARANKTMGSLVHLWLLNLSIFSAPRGLLCTSTSMGSQEVDDAISAFRTCLSGIAEVM